MKRTVLLSLALFTALSAIASDTKVAPSPNGITLPEGYKNWRVIAPSHRTDNKTIRVIVATMPPSPRRAPARPILGRMARFSANWYGRKRPTRLGLPPSCPARSCTPNS